MAIGSLAGGIAGMIEGRKGAKAMQQALAEARALAEQSVKEFEAIGIPKVEAQKLALQQPEVIGLLESIELEPSALEEIMTDPRMQEKQRLALEGMEEVAEEGFTEEDKARYEAMLAQAAGDRQAAQESVLQSMAERGALDSGSQLAAQLAAAQSGTAGARQQSLDLMASSAQAKRDALQRVGQIATQMDETDYRRQLQEAQAQDAISRFNVANRQDVARQNLGTRQRISETGTNVANRQQQYNKELLQQQYQNQMQRQQAIANARAGVQSAITNQGQARIQAAQNRAQAFGQLGSGIDQAGMAAAGAFVPGTGVGRMGLMASGVNPYDKNNKFANGGLANMQEYSDEKKLNEYEKLAQLGVIGAMGYKEGGKKDYKKMGYEEGGSQTEGRIVPGESFAGDELPDRINSGELVLNVEQQDRLNDMLQALKKMRTDDKLNMGVSDINEDQQEALYRTIKGDMPLEALPEEDVVEDIGEDTLEDMVDPRDIRGFQDGGFVAKTKRKMQDAYNEMVDIANNQVERENAPKEDDKLFINKQKDIKIDNDEPEPKSELQELMDKYKNVLSQRDNDMGGARKAQRQQALMNMFKSGLTNIASGLASSGGLRVNVPGIPQTKTDFLGETQQDYKQKMGGAMDLLKTAQRNKQLQDLADYRQDELDIRKKQMQARADERSEQRDLRQTEADRRLRGEERKYRKDIYDVITDFEKDEVTKAFKKQDLAFSQIGDIVNMVEKGNEVALGSLGAKAARAAGEVGVLTDNDIRRYIEAQSLVQKAKDRFGRLWRGKLSENTLKDLKEVSQKMAKGLSRKVGETREKYIDYAYQNFGKPIGMNYSEIQTRFGVDGNTPVRPIKGKETSMVNDTEVLGRLNKLSTKAPKGKVAVHLPGKGDLFINADKIDKFKEKYPNAVIQEGLE